ncbi:MAG TPA: hypothetical protein VHC23_04255, partial [Jatrophihabitans sp.]|nr:hypothetical protein [Jatrophihabitans sp.]
MSDDAELRARIEAQVAARRAGAAPAKGAPPREPDDPDEPAGAEPPVPRGLAPTRAWTRTPSTPPPAEP